MLSLPMLLKRILPTRLVSHRNTYPDGHRYEAVFAVDSSYSVDDGRSEGSGCSSCEAHPTSRSSTINPVHTDSFNVAPSPYFIECRAPAIASACPGKPHRNMTLYCFCRCC